LAAGLSSPAPVDDMHLTAPAVAGWGGPQAAADDWRPTFNGAAGRIKGVYRSNASGEVVELFHAIYTGEPRRGHTLITYENQLYDPAQAQILSSTSQQLRLTDGRSLAAGELRLSDVVGSRLVWYWYCVDARCTASPVLVKLSQAWDVLRGRSPRSSVWALSLPASHGDPAKAREALDAFVRALPSPGVQGDAP